MAGRCGTAEAGPSLIFCSCSVPSSDCKSVPLYTSLSPSFDPSKAATNGTVDLKQRISVTAEARCAVVGGKGEREHNSADWPVESFLARAGEAVKHGPHRRTKSCE